MPKSTLRNVQHRIILLLLSLFLGLGVSAQTLLMSQNFESGGLMPAGWAKTTLSGSDALSFSSTSSYPSGFSAYEGSYMVRFGSYSFSSADNRLYSQASFSTIGVRNVSVQFAWLESTAYASSNDRVIVQWSTDGVNWTNASTFMRYGPANAWTIKTDLLPAAVENQANVYLAFDFISAYGNDCYLDDVIVNAIPVLPTGTLQGYVTNYYGVPVPDATVYATNATESFTTTSGPNGAYSMNMSIGTYTVHASKIGYNVTTIDNIVILEDNITYQNFSLTQPSMAITPNPYTVTVNPNEQIDGAFNISNMGNGPLGWTAEIEFLEPIVASAPQVTGPGLFDGMTQVESLGQESMIPAGNGVPLSSRDLMTCPEGSKFSIIPQGSDNGYTSSGSYHSYQGFSGIEGSFNTLTFWSLYTSAPSGAMNFTIEVRAPGATPGPVLYTYTADILGVNTGVPVIGYPTIQYTFEFPESITLPEGYIGVYCNTASPTNYWLNTFASGPAAYQYNGSSYVSLPSRLAMCLGGFSGGWLTLGSYDGTVPAFQNYSLPAYFNAEGMEVGTYQANVTFTSNPNVGTVVVPVTMIVSGNPLGIPENLTATLTNPIEGFVNLTWTFQQGNGFLNFIVKRDGVVIGTTTTTSMTDDLPTYGVYNYTVQAVYADGASSPAGPVELEWPNPTIMVDPTYIYDEVWVNNTAVQTVTINNTGEGTLAFSFPDWVDGDNGVHAPLAYCTASGGCDEYISRIQFNTIDNSSACSQYADYTSIVTDLEIGETYVLTVTNGNAYSSDQVGVWIDWNQNEVFTDAGEFFTAQSSGGGASFTSNILVPETATSGPTRMRIRLMYSGTLDACGSSTYGEVEDYTVNVGLPGFITSVVPASGTVPAGGSKTVAITWDATGFDPGFSYFEDLIVTSNDLANPSVTIQNEMYVYTPAQFAGNVTDVTTGEPLSGVIISANDVNSFQTITDNEGNYTLTVDPGVYDVTFEKTGYQAYTEVDTTATVGIVTPLNVQMREESYPPSFVYAEVNDTDTEVLVTWGDGSGPYEIIYDDGSAENFAAWAIPGNMNAVKFTPASYPANVIGGKIYVGDGTFPNNNTGFIGTTFGAMVIDDDGANGLPGTVLDSISVEVTNLGWLSFSGLDAEITDGSFYLVMVQGSFSPNCAPIGVDQENPIVYRSYSRNISAGLPWSLSPYQDFMMRAVVFGSPSDAVTLVADNATFRTPAKQRGLFSQSPAITAAGGVEGSGIFKAALDFADGTRAVTGYRVVRYSNFDPNESPATGTITNLANNIQGNEYTDMAWAGLPGGWYAYGVAARYPDNNTSDTIISNIVGHNIDGTVTVNVSLTTGGSPAGALVTLTGQVYPYEEYSATVPESGQVIFDAVWFGNYAFHAEKVGFDDYDMNTLVNGDETINIILAERKYVPRNLYVDPLTLVATWDEPLAIAVMEDFEGTTFPPAGWQALTQNTTGWYATTNGSSSSFAIPSHTKYAVTNDDADNGDGCCDYLITPEMDWTNLPSYRLNFASYYDGSYSQSAYVEISTDAGASWTAIYTLAPAPGAWQNLEIDLAQYSGATGLQSVWLAFHADDNGQWASGWAVDDVQLASGGVPLQGYGVFLDGTLVGNTPERTFTYTNLNYGQEYLAGVAGLYSSGYSELDTYLFRSLYLIPPDNLAGENPNQTDYVHLTWTAPVVPTTAANSDILPIIQAQPAADIATNVNTKSFPQRSVPMSANRNILFDNGTIINSPGTGSGGADESILQGGLGMSTYGFGMQQSASNSVAEDFEVTANWNLETIEFFGYQTGSSTTSTFTGVFYRIYDGNPMSGGQVIVGDLTTNKLVSTQWANIYRNDNGPGGATDRPVMQIVADASGINLEPGTYWIEWTTTGSGSSGPWVPPITIEGQTTTGNAIQNQAGSWVALTDVGPQGLPFIINGSGGGTGPGVANLLGYNIYRDDALIAYVPKPNLEYFDLNLDPGTYTYHITAVYDLSVYGFPGQTGESMIEGPIDVDVIYGYELPFVEEWTTGVFTTNQWDAGSNWVIAGQQGNPAPSAMFTYTPVQSDYTLSLTSYWLNGASFVDGSIFADFDLKLDDNTATGEEKMLVEIFNGSSWVPVATYTAEGDQDWEAQHINITNSAKGKVFRVRFTAKGVNTLDINNWQIDNIRIYRLCEAPTNLVASLPNPSSHGDQILLTWEAPNAPGPGVSGWLNWDDGTNVDAIGLTGGGTFLTGVRFTPAQLAEFAGTSLTKIRMFPYGPGGTIVLKVWTGANASQLMLSQPVASYTAGQWNEFALTTPVPVTGTTELWFGYEVTHNGTDYVAGVDGGPAVAGYGDMISLDGSVWESMSQAYQLDFNWNTQGWVETLDGVSTPLQPISNNTVYDNSGSQLERGNYAMLPSSRVPSDSRALTGYNVYREGTMIATVPATETEYLDTDQTISVLNSTWCYQVTAVYEDCESDFSNEDCETVITTNDLELSAINVYPNPSNSIVNIELTNEISQIAIYNYVGQVVYEQVIAKDKNIQIDVRNYDAGAYLVKFTTKAGESFTKKIAVTK